MKWFYNMKIAAKLISSFVVVAIIAGIVGLTGIINIKTIDNNDSILYQNMTVPLADAAEMAKLFQRVRVNTRDLILENDLNEIDAKYKAIEEIISELNKVSEDFGKLAISEDMKKAFNEYMATRADFRSHLDMLVQLSRENRDIEAYALITGDMRKSADAEQAAIDKLVQMKVEDAKKQADLNTSIANRATITMIAIVAGGMIIAIILGIFIANIISNPVKKLSKAAESIADGDLNIEMNIQTKDEVGALAASFRKMADNLNDVMSNIASASEQVASGSKQVSDSSMALSQGATEQASSIEELTASLEEISAQTKQNADSANQANHLAEDVKTNASQGNERMKNMLKAMDEINDSSSNISKIIKVIDEIAFQTNILALNAAVEAARAGQHGKGFAVVAEEVRNLAARSANAAKETTSMIEGSIKKVEGGTKIANETADALNRIVEGVAKVAHLVGDIATASNEQAAGIEQINQGIMQVSQVVQTNSATSEESAAASEELAGQAELMREQVARFKLRRQDHASSYRNMEGINPEVLKMLEGMNKKPESYGAEETHTEAAAPKKIALSDREFGKY